MNIQQRNDNWKQTKQNNNTITQTKQHNMNHITTTTRMKHDKQENTKRNMSTTMTNKRKTT